MPEEKLREFEAKATKFSKVVAAGIAITFEAFEQFDVMEINVIEHAHAAA